MDGKIERGTMCNIDSNRFTTSITIEFECHFLAVFPTSARTKKLKNSLEIIFILYKSGVRVQLCLIDGDILLSGFPSVGTL